MADGGWVGIKKKSAHLEEEEGRRSSSGICVIRRSVSLASAGQQGWTAAVEVGSAVGFILGCTCILL